MIKTAQPALHGDQHLPDGSDPIPGQGSSTDSYRDIILATPSLWGFWPMDDPSGDFHNEVDASFPLVPTAHASFPFGYQTDGPFPDPSAELSASFDGTDSSIVVTVGRWAAVTANIFGTNNPFTAEAWLYPTVADYGVPLGHGGATTAPQWEIVYGYSPGTDQKLRADRGGSGGGDTGYVAPINTWTHVALTHDGSTTRLYANGVLIYSFASGATGTTETQFFVGRNAASLSPGTTARFFTGQISLVALYTAALDATDIAEHAAAPGIGAAATDTVLHADGAGGTFWATVDEPSLAAEAVTPGKIEPGTNTYVLQTVGGATVWAAAPGGAPTGAAGGALDGTYPNPGLAASVAGAGLAETANVLSVNVDGTTIEVSSDTLRVKADGITTNEIAANAVGASELASTAVTPGSYGDSTHIGAFTVDQDGRLTAASNVTFTTGTSPADTAGWMPLTTVVAGVPDLVWDGSNALIPTYGPF